MAPQRSGETVDSFITDQTVALATPGAGQLDHRRSIGGQGVDELHGGRILAITSG